MGFVTPLPEGILRTAIISLLHIIIGEVVKKSSGAPKTAVGVFCKGFLPLWTLG
jgi:hypothetical protein